MLRVAGKRLLGALPNLAGVVVITFLLTRALPGDPAAFFAGGAATPEAIETTIRDGRQGVMQAWGEQLGAEAVDQLTQHVLTLAGRSADAEKAAKGQELFQTFCFSCHRMSGQGNPAVGGLNLTDDLWRWGGSEATITPLGSWARNASTWVLSASTSAASTRAASTGTPETSTAPAESWLAVAWASSARRLRTSCCSAFSFDTITASSPIATSPKKVVSPIASSRLRP